MRREYRERFPHPPTSKETASERYRHASRHMRHARAVMHVEIAYLRWAGKTFPAFPAACAPIILRIWQEAHYTEMPEQNGRNWLKGILKCILCNTILVS